MTCARITRSLALFGLLVVASFPGRGLASDLLVVGCVGETAQYNTTTGATASLSWETLGRMGRHEDEEIIVYAATLAADWQSTLTLYVASSSEERIAWLRPYGRAPQYHFVPVESGGYHRGTRFDRRHRALAAFGTSSAAQPLVADFLDGRTVPASAEDCLGSHGDSSDLPLTVGTNAKLATLYPSCKTQIMQTAPYGGWRVLGQSPEIRCYRATEENYTTRTLVFTRETLGLKAGEVLKEPELLGTSYTMTNGGTSATAFLFLDRTTSATTFFRQSNCSDPYVFDEAVAMRVYRKSPGIEEGTGDFAFYLRADHVVVETRLDPQMHILYADRTQAYLTNLCSKDVNDLSKADRNAFYRLPLSPQGCGKLERLPDMPFAPSIMCRIPWEDLKCPPTSPGPGG